MAKISMHYNRSYLTFPIALLKGAFHDLPQACTDILAYCLYYHYTKKEEEGKDVDESLSEIPYETGINYPDVHESFRRGKQVFTSLALGLPKTSVKKKIFFEFYKQPKEEFEIVCFLAYAAIKSIIQKQGHKKITDKFLLCRMAGNADQDEPLPDWIKKYDNRYQMNKIKKELQLSWNLNLYSTNTMRGYWISFKTTLMDLAVTAESRKRSLREKNLSEAKKQAKAAALKEINKRRGNSTSSSGEE